MIDFSIITAEYRFYEQLFKDMRCSACGSYPNRIDMWDKYQIYSCPKNHRIIYIYNHENLNRSLKELGDLILQKWQDINDVHQMD